MKKSSWIKIASHLIKWIGIVMPAFVAAIAYHLTENVLLLVIFLFVFINKSLFDIYEAIDELKEQKVEDDRRWRNMLSKRKSL